MHKVLEELLTGGADAGGLVGELLRRGAAAILQDELEGEVTDSFGRDRYERDEEAMP